MMAHRPAPPLSIVEKTVSIRTMEEALQMAITIAEDDHLADMLVRLGVDLVKQDWAAAELVRSALLNLLPEEARSYVLQACALADMPEAAEKIAAWLAYVSLELADWIAGAAPGDTRARFIDSRLRVAAMVALGCGATAARAGRKPGELELPHEHAAAAGKRIGDALQIRAGGRR
jgi:hypothetical protein